jgi:hypothetical protein
MGLTQIPVDHVPLSTICHIDSCRLFNQKLLLGPLGSYLLVVKWIWTVSTILTNESSYIAMVRGLQPCVWSGPYNEVAWTSNYLGLYYHRTLRGSMYTSKHTHTHIVAWGQFECNSKAKGHFTHDTESPWTLLFKHSHWWKRRSWFKFASHYGPMEFVNTRWI